MARLGRLFTWFLLAGIVAFGGACGGGGDARRSAAPATTTIRADDGGAATIELTSRVRQRIDGWGTAVTTDTLFDPWASVARDDPEHAGALDRLVLRAGISIVRIYGPGPVAGKNVEMWSADDGRLRLARRLARKKVRLMFTGNAAPGSLLEGGGPYGRLIPGREAALANFLARSLQAAERAGVHFEFAAVGNEVDNDGTEGRLLAPEQAAAVAAALAGEIRRRGLDTRVALGDTTNWRSTLEYAGAQYRGLRRDQVGLVATHGYGGDESRPALAGFARRHRLPLWMTEWVSACPQGDCEDDPSIEFALRWARQITTDLTGPEVRAWFTFRGIADSTHGVDGAIVVRTRGNASQPFSVTKRYPVLRQFTTAAPPGARRVDTRARADSDLLRVAFASAGRRSLVVTNTGDAAHPVHVVLGRRAGRLRMWRTSASENFAPIATRRLARGEADVELPAQSVTTLVYDERPRRP